MVTQRYAYSKGFDTGYGIARVNIRKLARWGTARFIVECSGIEEDARQQPAFEITAIEFIRSRNPDGVCDAYDNGVTDGIQKVISEATSASGQKKPVRKQARK